jgi:hypothetical protein
VGTLIALALRNESEETILVHKLKVGWDGYIGAHLFEVRPTGEGFEEAEALPFCGPYINATDEEGAAHLVLNPGKEVTRELDLAKAYDLRTCREAGCAQVQVRYRALHRLPGGRFARIESEPITLVMGPA